MRKVFCDGCDAEIGEQDESANDSVFVLISRGTATKKAETFEYDLCASCEIDLRNKADPKKWPRATAMERRK